MELIDIVRSRASIGFGIYLSLTTRCPLECAHCSTNSGPWVDGDLDERHFIRFARSFPESGPLKLITMTGGEPFMRPALMREICDIARNKCIATQAITGAYFANGGQNLPRPIERAIQGLSHVTFSTDLYHMQFVDLTHLLEAAEITRELGPKISFQLTAAEWGDRSLEELILKIREHFEDTVPILVSRLEMVGRAAGLETKLEPTAAVEDATSSGCSYSSWPVVASDGRVVACCNQKVVDRNTSAAHLELGSITEGATWNDVFKQTTASDLLSLIRAIGPIRVSKSVSGGKSCTSDYCGACQRLSNENPVLPEKLRSIKSLRTMAALSQSLWSDFLPITHPMYRSLLQLGSEPEGGHAH